MEARECICLLSAYHEYTRVRSSQPHITRLASGDRSYRFRGCTASLPLLQFGKLQSTRHHISSPRPSLPTLLHLDSSVGPAHTARSGDDGVTYCHWRRRSHEMRCPSSPSNPVLTNRSPVPTYHHSCLLHRHHRHCRCVLPTAS